jgi:hypothetical protein
MIKQGSEFIKHSSVPQNLQQDGTNMVNLLQFSDF